MLAPTGWFRSSSTGSYLCPAPVPAGPLRWSTRPANSATDARGRCPIASGGKWSLAVGS